MKKIVLIVVIIIGLGIPVGIFVFHKIKVSNLNEKLHEALAKDQGLIEPVLKIEKELNSTSYENVFDYCSKSVTGRAEIIVELHSLYPNLESQLRDSLNEFFTTENEFVRIKEHYYRYFLSMMTASANIKNSKNNYDNNKITTADYDTDYDTYSKAYEEARLKIVDCRKPLKDYYALSMQKEKNIAILMKNIGLKYTPLFEKYAESNSYL